MNPKNPSLLNLTPYFAGAATFCAASVSGAIVHNDFGDLTVADPDVVADSEAYVVVNFDVGNSIISPSFSLSGPIPNSGAVIIAQDSYGPGKSSIHEEPARLSTANVLQHTDSFKRPALLTFGTPINGSTQTGGEGNRDEFSGSGYSGLRIFDNGNTYYGWLRVSTDGTSTTVYEAAFNNVPHQEILAGQTVMVPEPASMSLLALAGGVVALRYRRSRKAN